MEDSHQVSKLRRINIDEAVTLTNKVKADLNNLTNKHLYIYIYIYMCVCVCVCVVCVCVCVCVGKRLFNCLYEWNFTC